LDQRFSIITVIPILRIFDVEKAMGFYRDYLGMQVDWEHRFEPDMPLYCQVSRDGMELHLTEHAGDASPAARVFIRCAGVRALHAEVAAKRYPLLRPGLSERPWGLELNLTDPFSNRLTFCQQD
jgi:catechol 2,3-dioxygenase-like lactoylglutathione lyase family enzyme